MSKIDREIKAIIDDMGTQAQVIVPKLFAVMIDDDLDEDAQTTKIAKLMEEIQPKTYEIYIADLKQVFREAGWKEPTLGENE